MRFRVQQQQRAQQRALRTQQRREARQADRDSRYADDQVARGARGGPQGQAGRREGAPEKAPQAAATEEPPPAFSLRRSELAYKTVVSRSSGTCYGVCRTLWVDTDTWQVSAFDVADTVIAAPAGAVPLAALMQVGDVLLVRDDSAVEGAGARAAAAVNAAPAPPPREGALDRLVGARVVTEAGLEMGKVRDFEFDPSTGDVNRLVMDNLGVANLPETLLRAWAVPVSEVSRADAYGDVVLREGAEYLADTTSYGWLGGGAPWEAGYSGLTSQQRPGQDVTAERQQQGEYTYVGDTYTYDVDGGYAAAEYEQAARPRARRRMRRRAAYDAQMAAEQPPLPPPQQQQQAPQPSRPVRDWIDDSAPVPEREAMEAGVPVRRSASGMRRQRLRERPSPEGGR